MRYSPMITASGDHVFPLDPTIATSHPILLCAYQSGTEVLDVSMEGDMGG